MNEGSPDGFGHPKLFCHVLLERILEELGLNTFFSSYKGFTKISCQSVPLVAPLSACKAVRNPPTALRPTQAYAPVCWAYLQFRSVRTLLTAICIVTTLGPSEFGALLLRPQLTPGHSLFSHLAFASLTGPPGVRHSSFLAQPPDLLLRFYAYLSGFGLFGNPTHRLALYPVSVRRLLEFATPFPSPRASQPSACGSLRLVVSTRDRTFTGWNCAMPGTLEKSPSKSAMKPIGMG